MMDHNEMKGSPNSSEESDQSGLQGHVQEHVDLIVKHEQEFLAQRTQSERIGDRVASLIGSLSYVLAHVLLLAVWISWNSLATLQLKRFDPFPFPLLGLIFTFEAILVASFILMRQFRISRRQEERDQLMLQILLLTEREITAVLGVDRQIAECMGLHKIAADEEISQLSEQTSIDDMAQVIKDSLPTD
jgi:uncharacterized membrane protein